MQYDLIFFILYSMFNSASFVENNFVDAKIMENYSNEECTLSALCHDGANAQKYSNGQPEHPGKTFDFNSKIEDKVDTDLLGKSVAMKAQIDQETPISDKRMIIALTCCGDRVYEAINMMKSAIAMSTSPLQFELFTEEHLIPHFTSWISEWQSLIGARVKVNIRLAEYPSEVNEEDWKYQFAQCATFRLFLPVLLPEVDSVMYIDTDVVFLGPVEKLWQHFRNMNESHIAGMAPEHEIEENAWYNTQENIPYYGELGVNTGISLFNMTRMRQIGWRTLIFNVFEEFQSRLEYGDQDIMNILFHYHPDLVYVFGCEYNYRTDHCEYFSNCASAEKNGVYVLHGNRHVFHNNEMPVFRIIYEAWDQFDLHEDLNANFYVPLSNKLSEHKWISCGVMHQFLLHNVENFIFY